MRIFIDIRLYRNGNSHCQEKWTIVPMDDQQVVFPTVYRDHVELCGQVRQEEIECDQAAATAATAEAIRLGRVFPWNEVATLQLSI
jgi:hypothetical protein